MEGDVPATNVIPGKAGTQTAEQQAWEYCEPSLSGDMGPGLVPRTRFARASLFPVKLAA